MASQQRAPAGTRVASRGGPRRTQSAAATAARGRSRLETEAGTRGVARRGAARNRVPARAVAPRRRVPRTPMHRTAKRGTPLTCRPCPLPAPPYLCPGTRRRRHRRNGRNARLAAAGDNVDKVLNRNDPNYDSEEERGVVLTQQDWLKGEIQNYKREVCRPGGRPGGTMHAHGPSSHDFDEHLRPYLETGL
eukprot:360484-Chlamydomonas_euryale.AAC.5